jgi:CheY-like chemotaxis protein
MRSGALPQRVLVVDDERVIADTLVLILSQKGFEATAAYSGEKAVEAATAFRPDILIMDVIMGGMNGIEASLQISAILPLCKPGEPEQYIPKITQETLAEMIGTTRSRVSFFMNRFRKLGFIEYNGRIKVHKSLLNVVLLEQFSDHDPERLRSSGKAHTRSKPTRRA